MNKYPSEYYLCMTEANTLFTERVLSVLWLEYCSLFLSYVCTRDASGASSTRRISSPTDDRLTAVIDLDCGICSVLDLQYAAASAPLFILLKGTLFLSSQRTRSRHWRSSSAGALQIWMGFHTEFEFECRNRANVWTTLFINLNVCLQCNVLQYRSF